MKYLKFSYFLLFFLGQQIGWGEEGHFQNYDIRVIRPRFMSKHRRIEIGTKASVVMNRTFVYSIFVSGVLTYHFSEQFAFELLGSYGFVQDRSDKRILDAEFEIKTNTNEPSSIYEVALLFTPIYGKYQTSSGTLIYFDTYFLAGGGVAEIYYNREKNCERPIDPTRYNPRVSGSISYPSVLAGIGERFFLSKNNALKIEVKGRWFYYLPSDASCLEAVAEEKTEEESVLYNHLTLEFGYSYFF